MNAPPYPPGSVIHSHIGSNVWRTCNVVGGDVLFIHAEVVMRDVEQACAGRESGRLPVFGAGRRRAQVADDFARHGPLFFDVLQQAGFQIDTAAGGDGAQWLADNTSPLARSIT